MSYIEYYERLQHIKELVTKKATGSPKHLASRVGVSERSIYRLIEAIETMEKKDIAYSRTLDSYFFKE